MRIIRLAVVGLTLAGCAAPAPAGFETITVAFAEPQVLKDQLRIVSGTCGQRKFELHVQPGTFYNTDSGRMNVDPLVTVRVGSVTKRYDKSEPFVAEMFALHAPSYRFQATCYPAAAKSEIQLHAYGVSYSAEQPQFSNVLLVFGNDGSVLRYDNRPDAYDHLRDFLK